MSKNVIVRGALILAAANILVRIIGAIFRIPLANLLGEDGMGLFGQAHNIYVIMFVIATSGFPIAISKMVAEANAKGDVREAKRIFYVALSILTVVGAIGTVALYFGASWISTTLKNSRTVLGIMAISPAVFFVSISCAFRGYFQGKQNMVPTALSNLMEAMGKLFIGYGIAAFMLSRWGVEHGAAGALYGVAAGAALSAILLFITYVWDKTKNKTKINKIATTRKFKAITKELIWLAAPITIGAAVQSLTTTIDTFTITSRLQVFSSLPIILSGLPWIAEKWANAAFGMYSGFVMPISNVPQSIITAFVTPIVPAIAGALALGNKKKSHNIAQSAIRVTMLFILPCAVGIWALANPIVQTIFKNPPAQTGELLALLSPTILFMAIHSITTAILQGNGRMGLPVIFLAIGGVIKTVLNYTLIPIIGVQAAPISTNICYALIVILNIAAIIKVTGIKINIIDILIKPLAASGILAAVAIFSYNFITSMGQSVRISTVVSIMLAGVVYIITLLLIRAVKEEDVLSLPKGEKLAKILFKSRI